MALHGTAVGESILHALDLTMLGDSEGAKALLEPLDDPFAGRLFLLICEFEQHEQARKRSLALIRHEIGNALSIAQANIEGIMDGVLPQTPERLDGIHEALTTAGRLLDDLKRSPEGLPSHAIRIETFNICAMIAAQYATITGLAEAKNVRVLFDPCGRKHSACTKFRGDPTRIGQILRNVLINAVRFTPPGGTVHLICDHPDGELTVTVRDTGPGIDPGDLPRIFDEGYRGSNSVGSGLGLNVVSNLLKAFGGNARVVSERNGGATFTLSLPALPLV